MYSWEDERDMAPAPSLSEEHAFWHVQRNAGIIPAQAVCPLDCGENEWQMENAQWEWENDWETGTATCGHCKARLRSVEHVRLCPERP
jgi:hypothetical protein